MSKISFTIPQDPEVLKATAKMLLDLAGEEGCCSSGRTEGMYPKPEPAAAPPPPAAAPVPTEPAGAPPPPAAAPVPIELAAAPPPPAAPPEIPAAAPPPPAAPEVPATVPAGPAVELDIDGIPWDARIHATTKSKTKDGRWKKMRGSDPVLVEAVRAELLAATTTPDPAVPATVPAPPADVSTTPTTFPGIVAIVTEKQTLELLTVQEIQTVMEAHGLPSFPALATKQELIPAIYLALEIIWTAKLAAGIVS